MADRPVSPSPSKSQNLERGVFSSISSISLYKSVIEERKQLQSNSLIQVKSPKLKSPIRSRLMPSPKLTNRSKSPEIKSQSKPEDEIPKLHETIKKLSQQLGKEKRINDTLSEQIKETTQNHKLELSNATKNVEKLQKSLNSMKSNLTAVTAERDQLLENLKKSGNLVSVYQAETKVLLSVLIKEISQFIVGINQETKEKILKGLRNFMTKCKIDVNNAIGEVEK